MPAPEISDSPDLDRWLSPAILMIMPTRDNNAPPLSEGWEGRFRSFLMFHLKLAIQYSRPAAVEGVVAIAHLSYKLIPSINV
jgi:hypothetical protein